MFKTWDSEKFIRIVIGGFIAGLVGYLIYKALMSQPFDVRDMCVTALVSGISTAVFYIAEHIFP